MRALCAAALACSVLLPLSGCITLRAKTVAPLSVPEPPSRVVTPAEPAPEPAPPLPPVAPPTTATPPAPDKPPATSTTPPVRTTPPPVTSTAPPPETTPVLQPTVRVNNEELEKKIRTKIETATRDLDRIDRKTLARGGQEHYDWARKFCKEAENYIKARSYEMAEQYASKAASIASELGRSPISPTLP